MTFHNLIRAFIDYLRTPPVVHATHANNEIREEIEFHLNCSVAEKMDSGFDSQESQQLALERFGDVNSVLEDCRDVIIAKPVFFHRLHQCITLGLVGVVGFLCYSHSSQRHTFSNARGQADLSAITASGYSAEATDGDIFGSVAGDQGEVVSSAHVLAVVKTWPPNGYRQQSYMTTTRPDGSFMINNVYAPEYEYEIQIAVIAEGRLLNSVYKNLTTGTLEPFHFQLRETTPFALRFETGDGQPIEGVCAFPSQRVDNEGNQHSVYFSSADPIVRKSNLAGIVSMPHFLEGEQATVFVKFPDSDWQTRELIVPKGEGVVVVKPAYTNTLHGFDNL